ncbi:MAG: hypothetical protein HYV09_24090 [Deltaproteobacteria bacterium]|nr:hypothetical protein [Deltaproteobacteria bacterium]
MTVNALSAASVRTLHRSQTTEPVRLPRTAPPMTMVPEGMGLELLAALLVTQTSKQSKQAMRELQRDAKQTQIDKLREQVKQLHEKAEHVEAEGWVAGGITAAAGALTIASAAVGPSTRDAASAAQWEQAAAKHGGAFTTAAKLCERTLDAQKSTAQALSQLGQSGNGLASPLSKATFGARQIEDDADATRAAAEAKFAEAAKDEYAALARDFDAGSTKALQVLQAIAADRQTVRRSLLQRM